MATLNSETAFGAFLDFPEEEEKILQFWRDCDAFQKSYELSVQEGRKPYVFYDGPPFATVCSHSCVWIDVLGSSSLWTYSRVYDQGLASFYLEIDGFRIL